MIVPISADLQKSYRDTLNIPSAPQMIDTDEKIVPVAVIAQASVPALAQFQKITDGTHNLLMNTDGSISNLAVDKPLTMVYGQQTTAGTNTLGTVPAGKIWRIYSACLMNIATPAISDTSGLIDLKLDGNRFLFWRNESTYGGTGGTNYWNFLNTGSVTWTAPGNKYIELTAGKSITLVTSNSASDGAAWVAYIEVSA